MSTFVNFKKRGVTLPPGCKELIDLLNRGKRQNAEDLLSSSSIYKVIRDETFEGHLSELGRYVATLFESTARIAMLRIAALDPELSLDLHKLYAETVDATAQFLDETDNKRLIRAIFDRHGIPVPEESKVPAHFTAGQPVHLIYRIDPKEPWVVTRLGNDLFREFCGAEPDSNMRYSFYEVTDAT